MSANVRKWAFGPIRLSRVGSNFANDRVGRIAAVPLRRYTLAMSDGIDQTSPSAEVERNHMDGHPQNAWNSVQYDARFDEYSVQAGDALQSLFYCPWCGEKLPPTQRDRWFNEVEALGLDAWHDELPERFRSAAWWKGDGSTT